MTKRENFEAIKNIEAVSANADLVAFIDHEIELLNRKSSKSGKPTAKQVENEGIKNILVEILADADGGMTVTEILTDSRVEGMTNQKVSALLNAMVKANDRVDKVTEKKVSRFFLKTE